MPRANFFAQLGMFVVPGFFNAQLCATLRHDMRTSPIIPAPIRDKRNQIVVDESQRRTAMVQVSEETSGQVMSRLMATRPALERHFGIVLERCQPLSFLLYEEGYSFGRHTDAARDPEALQLVKERRVSVSIFLNGEGEETDPDTYGGGSLTFYGASARDERSKFPEISLIGEEGLLIGFRSDWAHSVKPISRGVRFSIVAWFI